MPIRQSFSDTIGHTPLIRLNRFSDATGCEILGKAEFQNPGGSVKDRAARGNQFDNTANHDYLVQKGLTEHAEPILGVRREN